MLTSIKSEIRFTYLADSLSAKQVFEFVYTYVDRNRSSFYPINQPITYFTYSTSAYKLINPQPPSQGARALKYFRFFLETSRLSSVAH